MGTAMRHFSFKVAGGPGRDLAAGFVPVDPFAGRDALRREEPGRRRRLASAARKEDAGGVKALEGFKPPNTTALRFY